jgi:hypothetical protein
MIVRKWKRHGVTADVGRDLWKPFKADHMWRLSFAIVKRLYLDTPLSKEIRDLPPAAAPV